MRKFWAVLLVALLGLGAWAQVRTGAWVDEVVFQVEPDRAKGLDMLRTGAIDLYWWDIADPDLAKIIVSELNYARLAGVYNELTFNPYGPEFKDGRLNPFSDPAIREAVNWLIDRDYIVSEFYGGITAVPRYFCITPFFPDYARYADVARALELKYAHNPEKAKAVIFEEMQKLGAEFVNGKWYYKGQPVELIFLIRVEDQRRQIGDYVATLFEQLGFTVTRLYKTSREASPIWMRGDPAEGQWHVYTGGWITTVVDRDQSGNFGYFYTPRGSGSPLWQAYKPSPEFDEVCDKLWTSNYKTLEERRELFTKALELSMKDSVRVWVVNQLSYQAYAKNVQVAADLAGGISGAYLWPWTVGFVDPATGQRLVGGTLRTANSNLLVDPWNPIAGSNWIFDMTPIRATADYGVVYDPYTGLTRPQRIERAEVTVQEGLPVGKTLDWVDLKFAPEIKVPGDAWVDWDPVAQRFITASEKYPEGLTALTKCVVYYPKDLWSIPLHDGSTLSIGDFIMGMILQFDRAKPESPIYDESAVPSYESFMEYFKGVRIISTDPLVIETYSDLWYLDAEWIVTTWFPYYSQGPGFWHNLAIGIKAEAAKELAFSADKAKTLGVDWMNYIAGPSLEILAKYLDEAIATNYIPYAPTMGSYLSPQVLCTGDKALQAGEATIVNLPEGTTHLTVANAGPGKVEVSHDGHVVTVDAGRTEKIRVWGSSLATIKAVDHAATVSWKCIKDEVAFRYENLKAWYEKVGHFWVGSGPFYVAEVRPVEKILVLKRFENYPDLATKWLMFAEPRLPTAEVSAPAPVLKLGAPWDFMVEVTFKDQPYPLVDMDFVTCLLFDAEGNLVYSGRAEAVKDGLFVFSIPASVTATLPVGSIRLEAVAVSKVVAIPAFAKAEFTAVK
jgi:peptide/nickel transport system substrate-binding protein